MYAGRVGLVSGVRVSFAKPTMDGRGCNSPLEAERIMKAGLNGI
jgi:hypothetical protein